MDENIVKTNKKTHTYAKTTLIKYNYQIFTNNTTHKAQIKRNNNIFDTLASYYTKQQQHVVTFV